MPVSFTPVYINECEKPFQINRAEVQQTYTYPDEEQKLVSQGLQLWLYTKRFGNYYLLVQTSIQMGNMSINAAFKLNKDLVDQTGSLEPLALLQALANTYGLTLKIGSKQGKFIYNEMIPVNTTSPTQLVQVINPTRHPFFANSFLKLVPQGGLLYAQCALAFCLDKDLYLNAIK